MHPLLDEPGSRAFNFPPVDQGSAATVNDNARITRAKTGTGTPRDTCSGCGNITWNAATRVLQVANNASLTLTGDVYSFCSLTIANNATLRIAPRDHSPEDLHRLPRELRRRRGDGIGRR